MSENIIEKQSVYLQLKVGKLEIISSYLLSKSILAGIYLAITHYEQFKLIEFQWERFFPFFYIENMTASVIFFSLLTLDTICFSYLIKNLVEEINNRVKWILAIGFLITPFVFKTLLILIYGKMTYLGLPQLLRLEINYLLSDMSIFSTTLLALIYKVCLCYFLLGKFKSKKETSMLLKIDKRHFLWLFLPVFGYVYFISTYIFYFISNYSNQFLKPNFTNRLWWISKIELLISGFILLVFIFLFSFSLFVNLEKKKKSNGDYFILILNGIVIPIILVLFINQIMVIISNMLNFLNKYIL
jgi:hypothetical protein